jgi:hypothetical protein
MIHKMTWVIRMLFNYAFLTAQTVLHWMVQQIQMTRGNVGGSYNDVYEDALWVLLHIRFPWEHDLCILLHFHGNVTVRGNEFVPFP